MGKGVIIIMIIIVMCCFFECVIYGELERMNLMKPMCSMIHCKKHVMQLWSSTYLISSPLPMGLFLAATKQLYERFSPFVRPSVRPPGTHFLLQPIIVS